MGEKIIERDLFGGEAEVSRPVPATSGASIRIRPVLSDMELGDEVFFPVEKMRSIRAIASDLGVIMNRRYQTKVNREARVISVIRTA